ncbi:MAG: acyl-CoA dehydrogenase family protein [Candidatus Poribacteria bacterium]|nr:acyl-CoA dehydrogenase family protein [Candidatus Poribacteria bacterium]MDE0504002.1 acyl-CoA dehydrogenase family protein [Candidatus Poribacteria bacterium]
MEFDLSIEHRIIQQQVYDFSRDEVIPIILEHDKRATFPHELIPKLASRGYLGVCLPIRYAGAGRDYESLALVSEGLEWADSSVRETIAVHLGLHALPIFQWGTEAQKKRFLPSLASGENIGCFGLTESGCGSDVSGLTTHARKEGGRYILTGEKTWVTLANVADRMLIFAKTEPSRGTRGITAFILERGWNGVATGAIAGKMGVRASDTGWIKMDNVVVPDSHRLGEEGEGFKIAMSALDIGRYSVAAGAVGLMKACLQESVRYASERKTFGKPIAEHQLVQQMIALMQQRIDLGELLVRKVGHLKNRGVRNTRETSMAKWYCTESANATANDAVQIHGAYGYSDACSVERHLRNSKSATIYEGTTQIHQLMQAGYVFGFREDKPLRCELPAYDADYWQTAE